MALYRRALELVTDRAQSAELLTATGAAGSTVQHLRYGHTVSGGFARVVAGQLQHRPCHRARRRIKSVENASSALTIDPTRLPFPNATAAVSSSTSR